ncbi:MAG TPA: pyruvate kinase [Candidatus Fimenecus excrementigallinarum]|uniref:Pyruvate kinase n=1 Tax=Candidatus Fimenecus excrementigallinarum TaxID=2840816 RepID=A0A9D1IFT9_9FIRM|nr:pyruvate kinase [Candidatus Fimenecus excrementigallinarum]
MRKTKIICTVGPATDRPGILEQMMRAGMNVARFNFSHSDYETHERRFRALAALRETLGLPVASMLDTRGPEIRLGVFRDHKPVEVRAGDTYTLTTRDVECDDKVASVSFKGLPGDVRAGTRILINDGLVAMRVEKVTDEDVVCTVEDGGMLSDRKGVNVPGVELSMPYLSETDMNDLEFGAKLGFDFIAASFVRSAADVAYLRKFTNALGWRSVRIIAKIENMDGVNNIDEIIEAADGIMVARGDMGVEIPFEKIPPIQKQLIKKAYSAGKQVVTATQMLESMITNPRPTRAEITDVANAVYDGTSAIMLSGETAAGAHPVEAVETMALIAESTESQIDYVTHFKAFGSDSNKTITNAISHATVTTAHDLGAKAIITVTKSGSTARMISKHRPQSMIIGCTTNETVCRQMSMSWGIIPLMCDEKRNTDELFSHAVDVAQKHGLIGKGDTVVITAGIPLGVSGTTNMLKVEKL